MAKQRARSWDDRKIRLSPERWVPIAEGVRCFRMPGREPVRRIITGRRNNYVGGYYSWKMQAHVIHESEGEEKYARLLDLHPDVTAFFGQPETLLIQKDESLPPERYTPDFLVQFGAHEIRVEIKRDEDINPPKPDRKDDYRALRRWENADETKRHLAVAQQAYQDAGLFWTLVTDLDLAKMAKLETLDEVVANLGRPLPVEAWERLSAFLLAQPAMTATLGECERALADRDFARGDILSRIPERRLRINLLQDIGPATPVTLIQE